MLRLPSVSILGATLAAATVAAGLPFMKVAHAASDEEILGSRNLLFPLPGVPRSALRDNFGEARGTNRHHALDIPAPRGSLVVAVDSGRIAKLFDSKAGGITLYQFDRDEKYAYYYAHLDRYAEGISEGKWLERGDPVGYVGSTGNARHDAPHLHFTISRLGPDKKWWSGVPVNPYRYLAGGNEKR